MPTGHRNARIRRERYFWPLACTTAFHGAVLVLLFPLVPPAAAGPAVGPIEVSLVGDPLSTAARRVTKILPSPPSPEPPPDPPPPAEPDVEPQLRPVDPTALPTSLHGPMPLDAPAPGTPTPRSPADADCGMAAALQAAVENDESFRAAVMRIPRSNRSVANAVMLWDGAWVDGSVVGGGDVMSPIRAAITAVVARADSSCRAMPVVGVRLLSVQGSDGVTILALGSGQWRWANLLAETTAAPGDSVALP